MKGLKAGLPLQGDLEQEIWLPYLKGSQYPGMVRVAIQHCDFCVECVEEGYGRGDFSVFFVRRGSTIQRGRHLAVHPDDPKGVIYILEDDPREWEIGRPVKPVWAVTLGELTKSYASVVEQLQLNREPPSLLIT